MCSSNPRYSRVSNNRTARFHMACKEGQFDVVELKVKVQDF